MNARLIGKASSPAYSGPVTTAGSAADPTGNAVTDGFEGARPRTQRLLERLASPTKNRWLTIGIPTAFIALGGAAAIAYFGGWITPGGAPLHDGGREDLSRSILFGDRDDGPDAPAKVKAPSPTPNETPARVDGPN